MALAKFLLGCVFQLSVFSTAMYANSQAGEDAVALPCDLLKACYDPLSCPILNEEPPSTFDFVFNTTKGSFVVEVVTAWAPPYAARMWHLSRLQYFENASFYRVLRKSPSEAFVVQFGYRGDPEIDECWDSRMSISTTWSVNPPGNQRGYVSFSMEAVNQTGENPNCTSDAYCAQGFSTNIFINLADNRRLDAAGFSIFGKVRGIEIVDRLFARYGDCQELCAIGSSDPFCVGTGSECEGVSMTRLLAEGAPYIRAEKPLLDFTLRVAIAPSTAATAAPSSAAAAVADQ